MSNKSKYFKKQEQLASTSNNKKKKDMKENQYTMTEFQQSTNPLGKKKSKCYRMDMDQFSQHLGEQMTYVEQLTRIGYRVDRAQITLKSAAKDNMFQKGKNYLPHAKERYSGKESKREIFWQRKQKRDILAKKAKERYSGKESKRHGNFGIDL